MPCYDPPIQNSYSQNNSYSETLNIQNVQTIVELKNKNKYLEACLCAIITELEKRNIANEIISNASKKGLVGIMEFWIDHSKKDKNRLAYELHKYSEHEQGILRKLLSK